MKLYPDAFNTEQTVGHVKAARRNCNSAENALIMMDQHNKSKMSPPCTWLGGIEA